jgi:hypothetical protein
MADTNTDPVDLIARDIRVVWAAFKRMEAVSSSDKGLFSNACAIAVSAELQANNGAADFDVIKYTKLACQLQTLFNKK